MEEKEMDKQKEEMENIKVEEPKKEKKEKKEKKNKKDEEIEKLKKALAEKHDQYVRVVAELENFRKRTEKENVDKLKFANQKIITALLTVIDHLDMAISHITPESSIESLLEGVELTLKQFADVLKRFGVKEIDVEVGDDFNPNLHEAMMLANDPSVANNKITMVLQKGFILNDRVIRPAKVQVNKVSEGNNENNIKEESNE
jgi:molecular chaperone GrpE